MALMVIQSLLLRLKQLIKWCYFISGKHAHNFVLRALFPGFSKPGKSALGTRLACTGSPSSKYEDRRGSTSLRIIQNISICMGKENYRFCNLRKWKDFNKKQLNTLLKMCVTSLLCGPRADLWPFYGFLCKRVWPVGRTEVSKFH